MAYCIYGEAYIKVRSINCMKKLLVLVLAVLTLVLDVMPTLTSPEAKFDYLLFSKTEVLHNYHPTTNSEKVTAEYEKKPCIDGDKIMTVRVCIFLQRLDQKSTVCCSASALWNHPLGKW